MHNNSKEAGGKGCPPPLMGKIVYYLRCSFYQGLLQNQLNAKAALSHMSNLTQFLTQSKNTRK